MGNDQRVCRSSQQRAWICGLTIATTLLVGGPRAHAEETADRVRNLDGEVEVYYSHDKHALAIRPMMLGYLLRPNADRLWNLALLHKSICQPLIAIELFEQFAEEKNCTKVMAEPNKDCPEMGECSRALNHIRELKKEYKCDDGKAIAYAKLSLDASLFETALTWHVRRKPLEALEAYQRFKSTRCQAPETDPRVEKIRLRECEDALRFSQGLAELHPDLAEKSRRAVSAQETAASKVNVPSNKPVQESRAGVVALAASRVSAAEEASYIPPIDKESQQREETLSKERQASERRLREDLERQKQRSQQEVQRVRLQVERERAALERERQELQASKEAEAADRLRQREKEKEEDELRHPERVGRSTRIAGIVVGSIGLAVGLGGALYAVSGMPQLNANMQSAPATPAQEQTQLIGWSIAGAGAGVAALGGLLLIIGRSMQQNAIMRANQRRGTFARITPLLGPISGMALSVEY